MGLVFLAVFVIVCVVILLVQYLDLQNEEWQVKDRDYRESPLWRTKR